MLIFAQETVDNGSDFSVSLWTVLIILAIIALLVFIFRSFRR